MNSLKLKILQTHSINAWKRTIQMQETPPRQLKMTAANRNEKPSKNCRRYSTNIPHLKSRPRYLTEQFDRKYKCSEIEAPFHQQGERSMHARNRNFESIRGRKILVGLPRGARRSATPCILGRTPPWNELFVRIFRASFLYSFGVRQKRRGRSRAEHGARDETFNKWRSRYEV